MFCARLRHFVAAFAAAGVAIDRRVAPELESAR
jgi:hypothetical protein